MKRFVLRLSTSSPDFSAQFDTLVDGRRETDADVSRDVDAIIARVRGEGDAAIADLTARFDRHDLPWSIPLSDCKAALEGLEPELRGALELAAARITLRVCSFTAARCSGSGWRLFG